MNEKEARELLEKSKTPGALFYVDDARSFDLNKETARAEGFLEGLEQGRLEEASDSERRLEEERRKAEGLFSSAMTLLIFLKLPMNVRAESDLKKIIVGLNEAITHYQQGGKAK